MPSKFEGYPEEFINDLWTGMTLKERIKILELASIDLKEEYMEWESEVNDHDEGMREALGIAGKNWGKEDDEVDLNPENN